MNRFVLAAGALVLGAALTTTAIAQTRATPPVIRPTLPPSLGGPSVPRAPTQPAGPQPTAADWRTPDPQNVLVIDTNKGRIFVELIPELAPAHVERLRTLARRKFYDGLQFFRVVDNFMDQTGDPQNTGQGGSDLPDLKGEFTFRRNPATTPFVQVAAPTGSEVGFVGPMAVMSQVTAMSALTADGKVSAWGLFCPGVIGMARATDPDSANSQFYLMRATYPSLDKNYTAFGRALSGLSVIRDIKLGEPVADPRDVMERVQVLADMSPMPSVRVVDTRSAWFKGEVERRRASRGADFSACDIELPSEVK
ncbi:MAG: peptidylprolyl isomerase [Caulobacterales bacterium]|nr:peptidylprolyl isomerase [Caulobacterales bacterium]